jgi:DNA-binding transcriptional ArsR family regulator
MKHVIVMVQSIAGERPERFVYYRTMESQRADAPLAGVAAAIADPARSRMLCCLLDGQARTSTELAAVAGVAPSTASAHLARLEACGLLTTARSGRHRYHALAGLEVARALEALMIVAGGPRESFVPRTPATLRAARTCYDHLAGALAVDLHDRFRERGWISMAGPRDGSYDLTAEGAARLEALGVDVRAAHARRRRFAYACLDWSERRPHIGGALGAALLDLALRRGWVVRELDSRVLQVTRVGRREIGARFAVSAEAPRRSLPPK